MRLPALRLPLPSRTALLLSGYGLLCYLLFLLASIPAALLWQQLPAQYRSGLQTTAVRGTLWSGQFEDLQIRNLALGRLQWQLNRLPLLLGRLDADLKLNGPLGALRGSLGLDSDGALRLSGLRGRIPAEALNPYTLPASLDGLLELDIDQLDFQPQQRLRLQGKANWRKAVVSLMQSVELGEVNLLAKADGDGSVIHISNSNSPLGIEGSARLDAAGNYDLNLGLVNRDSRRKDIASMLKMLGRPDAAGKVYLRRKGRLALNF